MNALQLESLRAELAREILNEQDENLLKNISAIFKQSRQAKLTPPCRYTLEELKERLAKSEEDFRAGRYHTMDEIRNMFPRP
jgi:hypothetical protein